MSRRLPPGLRRALRTLQAHDPDPVATGRSTTPYQIPYLTGVALERRGLAKVRSVERIHLASEVELTDAGRAWVDETG